MVFCGILFVAGGLFLVSIIYQNEEKKYAEKVKEHVEEVAIALKEHVEQSVKEGLTEKIGARCISVTLREEWDKFVGDAKLEDGRELDITASAHEGGKVLYTYIFKRGYEYKCKHHIDQVSLRFNESKTDGKLSGRVWNDESHPIRGFVAIEIIDKNSQVYHTGRQLVYGPDNSDLHTARLFVTDAEILIFCPDWIPVGKNYKFSYVAEGLLFKEMASAKIEFFNLADYEPRFLPYTYDYHETQKYNIELLKSIPIKLTTGKILLADINMVDMYKVDNFSEEGKHAKEYVDNFSEEGKHAKEYFEVAKTGTGIRQAQAMFNLGVLYETGQEVKKDTAKAIYWYKESAKHGYKSAQEKLVELGVAYPAGAE